MLCQRQGSTELNPKDKLSSSENQNKMFLYVKKVKTKTFKFLKSLKK